MHNSCTEFDGDGEKEEEEEEEVRDKNSTAIYYWMAIECGEDHVARRRSLEHYKYLVIVTFKKFA